MDKEFLVIVLGLVVIIGMLAYTITDFAVQPIDDVDDYWLDCDKALDVHLREAGFVYSAGYVADCQIREALIEAEIMQELEDVNSDG